MRWLIVGGLEVVVVEETQEKPQTTVVVRHISESGVAYEAKRQALWDGDGEWDAEEGVRIAVKRAARSIARQLAREAGLEDEMLRADEIARHFRAESERFGGEMVRVYNLHKTGGTVNL